MKLNAKPAPRPVKDPAHSGVELFDDYKDYLRHRIEAAQGVKGYQTLLAGAAGCHPSFISQVLNTSVHLTPDHAAGLAELWSLDELDTELFLCLVQAARASSASFRRLLEKKQLRLRREKRDLAKRFRSPRLSDEERERRYYASWLWAAAHVLTSVPEYQRPARLAERLGISSKLTQQILTELEAMDLVSRQGERWVVTGKSLHLPRQSPLLQQHLLNWRHRALVDAALPAEESIHYSAVHGLSKHDVSRLRELILRFLDETRRCVAPSPEEEVVCLSLDFFPV